MSTAKSEGALHESRSSAHFPLRVLLEAGPSVLESQPSEIFSYPRSVRVPVVTSVPGTFPAWISRRLFVAVFVVGPIVRATITVAFASLFAASGNQQSSGPN